MCVRWFSAVVVVCLLVALPTAFGADPLRLTQAVVVLESEHPVVANAARVLSEEIEKRTGLQWMVGAQTSQAGARVVLAVDNAAGVTGPAVDGFRITVDPAVPAVRIVGNSPRGVLFGVGHLLRKSQWRLGSVELPGAVTVNTSPTYPLRGHQLGYRSRANSYDKWDAEQYEQYIRELAIFGANAIENIPNEGGQASEHMTVSREIMNVRMSEICAQYGLDFWMWIPATFDLTDSVKRAAGLVEHEAVYGSCPRVDHIFFPGGDPGDNHPRDVLPYLVDVAKILKQHHPDAMIWLSMQGFHGDEVDYVFDWLETNDARDWFGGLVAGPSSAPIPATRARLAKHYDVRHYPDITHVVRCQYPVSYWDPAYARTHTREPVTVRPRFQRFIHNTLAPHTVGFLSYSDGVHDDANKAVWSQLGWNPELTLREILEDYARFFLNAEDAPQLADLLLAFERHWGGPLDTNGGVSASAVLWRNALEKHMGSSGDSVTANWRIQMFVLRAYLDAHTRLRLLHENELQARANATLLAKLDDGADAAMAATLAVLMEADNPPAEIVRLRHDIVSLGEGLWHSIGFQSSVKKYQAATGHRGAVLDYLEVPLNDRWWLEDEFKKVHALEDEAARLARLRVLALWDAPGDGSFYDDLGHAGRSPHVVFPEGANAHPLLQRQPNPTYWSRQGGFSRLRQAWLVTLRRPYKLRYKELDKTAEYTLRLSGYGEAKPRAGGVALKATKYGTEEGAIKEFPIPPEVTAAGSVEITFDELDERHLNWRVKSRLAEAWLLRSPRG
jgi:hypothetical protein